MTTQMPSLTVHVVAAKDAYDTRRCLRCKKPSAPLDTIATDGRAVTHVQCLTQRDAATLPVVDIDEACWYVFCVLAEAQDHLCASHHAILYGAPKKQTRR